jgi:hypothetical protein
VRSLLASKPAFTKIPRAEGVVGKGNYWTIDSAWTEVLSREILFTRGIRVSLRPKKEKQPADQSTDIADHPSHPQHRHVHLEHLPHHFLRPPPSINSENLAQDSGNLALLTASLEKAHKKEPEQGRRKGKSRKAATAAASAVLVIATSTEHEDEGEEGGAGKEGSADGITEDGARSGLITAGEDEKEEGQEETAANEDEIGEEGDFDELEEYDDGGHA